jgi:hypothetical protein
MPSYIYTQKMVAAQAREDDARVAAEMRKYPTAPRISSAFAAILELPEWRVRDAIERLQREPHDPAIRRANA